MTNKRQNIEFINNHYIIYASDLAISFGLCANTFKRFVSLAQSNKKKEPLQGAGAQGRQNLLSEIY